jgi:hypothetical protein
VRLADLLGADDPEDIGYGISPMTGRAGHVLLFCALVPQDPSPQGTVIAYDQAGRVIAREPLIGTGP